MRRPILCLVTDGARTETPLVALVAAAAQAGVDLVQIRERGLDDRAQLALTRDALDAVRGTRTRVLVNGRSDIALAAGANGVHLRGDSIPASHARSLVPPSFVIGRSVHSEAEAVAVEREGGCDYLIFGTVFESLSKPGGHAPVGIEALGRVCGRVRLPVLAIGGVTPDRAAAIASAGAAGLAAIGMFIGSENLSRTCGLLREPFDT